MMIFVNYIKKHSASYNDGNRLTFVPPIFGSTSINKSY